MLKKYPNTRNLYGFQLDGTPQYLFTLTETNYSKQGGKWVVDNTETTDCSIETYFNVFDAIPFFKNLGGTEKVETKSVVGPGHIPVMVTSISPDRTQKTVRQFEIRENPNF